MLHLQIDGLSCKKVCLTLNITPRFRRFPKDIIVPSNLQHGGSPPMLENCSGLCAAQPGIHWDAFPSLFDAGDLTPRDIARRTPAVTYAAQDAKTAPGRWAIDSRSIWANFSLISAMVKLIIWINGVWLYAINQMGVHIPQNGYINHHKSQGKWITKPCNLTAASRASSYWFGQLMWCFQPCFSQFFEAPRDSS